MSQTENLEALNKELNAIINSSYDGIFVTDGEGYAKRMNKAYERISHFKATELLGLHMSEIVRRGFINASVTLEVLEKRKTVTIIQNIRGTQVMATGNPVWDGDKIVAVVTNIRDLTELNSLKEQLQSSVTLAKRYEEELAYLRSKQLSEHGIVAVSPVTKSTLEKCRRLANVDSAVLITGETGVGKEIFAKFIHSSSIRFRKPFMMINCTTLPENLLESELFGYERGAFTGAKKEGKIGLIELAEGGTFLFDEIGDLSLSLQAKLLRLLQQKEYIKVGGNVIKTAKVRFLAATHKNLLDLANKGLFREDLYYRLSVVPLHIPPLRDRIGDILPLIQHFLGVFNEKYSQNKKIDGKTLEMLIKYNWPGNIRELEHTIEQLAVLSVNEQISVDDLPDKIRGYSNWKVAADQKNVSLEDTLEQTEKNIICTVLSETENIYITAAQLGIHRTTLLRKMKKYNINLLQKNEHKDN